MDVGDVDTSAEDFFAAYRQALLARDADALARLYAVPGLILFPGQSVPVSSTEQTRQFFTAAFQQYEGVTQATADVTVLAQTVHSIWVDVTWQYDRGDGERMIYQLVDADSAWRIAVLTPVPE